MAKLRIAGTAAALFGSAVSVSLLLIAGKSTPLLLLVLFVGWVVLPFVVLVIGIVWKGLSDKLRSCFSVTSIVVAFISITVYSYFTFLPPTTTPARTWLLTPGFSFIAIAIVLLLVRLGKH